MCVWLECFIELCVGIAIRVRSTKEQGRHAEETPPATAEWPAAASLLTSASQ